MPTEFGLAELIALGIVMLILWVAWKLATGKSPLVQGQSPTWTEVNESYESYESYEKQD